MAESTLGKEQGGAQSACLEAVEVATGADSCRVSRHRHSRAGQSPSLAGAHLSRGGAASAANKPPDLHLSNGTER